MVKRSVLAALAFGAGLSLAGCISDGAYSQASLQPQSQEILDGTIRNPADWEDEAAPRPPRRTARVPAGSVTVGAAKVEETKVFSDEWWAKENRENERLKSRMTICRGC